MQPPEGNTASLSAIALVTVSLAYVLSVGPAEVLCRHGGVLSENAVCRAGRTFYAPLVWASENDLARPVLRGYVDLWRHRH